MNEEQVRAIEAMIKRYHDAMEAGELTIEEAGNAIFAYAPEIRESRAYGFKGNTGLAGYKKIADYTKNALSRQMAKVLFAGHNEPSSEIITLYDQGKSREEILDSISKHDTTGYVAQHPDFYREAMDYVIRAYETDKAQLPESRRLLENSLYNFTFPEPDPADITLKVAACGMEPRNPGQAENDNMKATHDLLVESALKGFDDNYHIPRWANCLLKRPGMTEDEKRHIETLWNRDREGKKEVFEMFFREIEQLDPANLDVDNVEMYKADFAHYDYLGGIAFEREFCTAEYTTYGFTMSDERKADMKVVAEAMSVIQNKYNKLFNILEHPISKYIDHPENIDQAQAVAMMTQGEGGSQEQYFGNECLTYTGNLDMSRNARAKEILDYNKEFQGAEREDMLTIWYAGFKQTLTSQGIDLDDPLAMARIKAQIPGNPNALYFPAMKGYDKDYNVDGMSDFPDTEWYKTHLTSANQLSMDQISNLYELSRKGKLAVYGTDMSEESMRIIYNNKQGDPQVSALLRDVNNSFSYSDEEGLAKEFFPDATHPYRVYKEAIGIHLVNRNQIPMVKGEDGSYDFDTTNAPQVGYTAMLFSDYFEHGDKYATPEEAQARAEQVYVVANYNYGNDEEFRNKYADYVENNDIVTEKIQTPQEKAIESINNPQLKGIKVPEITEEMITFYNSLAPAMREGGWNPEDYADKALLKIYTNKAGSITEVPAFAPLNFQQFNSTYALVGDKIDDKNRFMKPEERYLMRNNMTLRPYSSAEEANNKCTDPSSRIRFALIYEAAKRGELLINKPGEKVATALPVVVGPDGKARVVQDFDNLPDAERKRPEYINANRIRTLSVNPNEEQQIKYLNEHRGKILPFAYELKTGTMVSAVNFMVTDAKGKGIKDKNVFLAQANTLAPKVDMDLATCLSKCDSDDDDEYSFEPNKIPEAERAGRKALSARARNELLSTKFDVAYMERSIEVAVERGVITKEEGLRVSGERGLTAIFFDPGDKPETIEFNIEAARILARGSNEEITALYNKRLDTLASFNVEDYMDISDSQLVDKYYEIDTTMYRLQELISIDGRMKARGINADPGKLKAAMNAERNSGDMYLYLCNKMECIANVVYETVDLDQLLNQDGDTLRIMNNLNYPSGSGEFERLMNNATVARQGLTSRSVNTISATLMDLNDNEIRICEVFTESGKKIEGEAICKELEAGRVVYAAQHDQDRVYAFKSMDGSWKPVIQPGEEYSAKCTTMTNARIQKRLAKEQQKAEADARRAIRAEELRNEAAGKRPEINVIRDQVQASLKEEIEYQQVKLGLIIDSYGPNGLFKDKVADYKALSGECAAQILILSRALEKSEAQDLPKDKLEKLGAGDGIAEVRKELEKEEGYQRTLRFLDTEKLSEICGRDFAEGTPQKMKAAADFYSTCKINIAMEHYEKELGYKYQAKEARKAGIDRYKEFGAKLDEVLDYGQYKLAAAARGMERQYPGAEDNAKTCLAELFAASVVKDIIDNKVMTYNQAKELTSPQSLKKASQDILADPAFNELFSYADTKKLISVGEPGEDGKFNRDAVKDMLQGYKEIRENHALQQHMRDRENVRQNEQPKGPNLI